MTNQSHAPAAEPDEALSVADAVEKENFATRSIEFASGSPAIETNKRRERLIGVLNHNRKV